MNPGSLRPSTIPRGENVIQRLVLAEKGSVVRLLTEKPAQYSTML